MGEMGPFSKSISYLRHLPPGACPTSRSLPRDVILLQEGLDPSLLLRRLDRLAPRHRPHRLLPRERLGLQPPRLGLVLLLDARLTPCGCGLSLCGELCGAEDLACGGGRLALGHVLRAPVEQVRELQLATQRLHLQLEEALLCGHAGVAAVGEAPGGAAGRPALRLVEGERRERGGRRQLTHWHAEVRVGHPAGDGG